jgi:hypothetical protein
MWKRGRPLLSAIAGVLNRGTNRTEQGARDDPAIAGHQPALRADLRQDKVVVGLEEVVVLYMRPEVLP